MEAQGNPQAVGYNADRWLPKRVLDHAKLGLKKTIQPHERNKLEMAGDVGLWLVEELPKKFLNFMQDPRVITAFLTAGACVADSYLFYPSETTNVLQYTWKHIPKLAPKHARFAAYLYTMNAIVSYGARAQGRFWNSELMQNFYQPPQADQGQNN